MSEKKELKNRDKRYETIVKMFFEETKYDVRTKIHFHLKEKQGRPLADYLAFTRNISIKGLCFNSREKLEKGDRLFMETILRHHEFPVVLEGEVRWSRAVVPQEGEFSYDTGVRLYAVNGSPVDDSIHFDKGYNLYWSNVLESVLNIFKAPTLT